MNSRAGFLVGSSIIGASLLLFVCQIHNSAFASEAAICCHQNLQKLCITVCVNDTEGHVHAPQMDGWPLWFVLGLAEIGPVGDHVLAGYCR